MHSCPGSQLAREQLRLTLAGKWVGFGRDFDVNTGPWELRLMDADTGKVTLAKYDRPPEG